MPDLETERRPDWLKIRMSSSAKLHEIKRSLRSRSLHTVCESAGCPNICECFQRKTATFMIMGNICTRDCGFCAVNHGIPGPLNPDEPGQVAEMARDLDLRHVVVTSVTRDDLPDGGASHFAATIGAIRALLHHNVVAGLRAGHKQVINALHGGHKGPPLHGDTVGKKGRALTIEVLTPDFNGDRGPIQGVLDAGPDVFNHNLETVERLTKKVRSRADYNRSLNVLKYVRGASENIVVKSGLMVGLGERDEEIYRTLEDLADAGCDIVTIGQYLRPSRRHLAVERYVEPKCFTGYKEYGESVGIKLVFADPLVRSSYMAEEVLEKGEE